LNLDNMKPTQLKKVCIVPQLSGVGGMVSFHQKLILGLESLGVEVTHDLNDPACDTVLVIGGTRHLGLLWRARRRGAHIVQRLDGMNWLHRRLRTGLRHYLRAEYGNLLLSFIRNRSADFIVYQSRFSQSWWENMHGLAPVPSSVVYNGVDLTQYTPRGAHSRPQEYYRILLVEGSLMGGYEIGLDVTLKLVEGLSGLLNSSHSLSGSGSLHVELMVVGRVSDELKRRFEQRSLAPTRWAGILPQDRIPEVDRSAHLLYSSDVNAACPNSVIEALACALPVLAYDTGALPEMVTGGAGRIVPYGGDPWRLDAPDIQALIEGAVDILQNQESYRQAARQRAEEIFSLEKMVQGYIQAFTGV
jgi:glycosyltransferase involved in cell wall biosynthesis